MKGELVYRILVRGNCISVEFFHILTDGGGAIFFLKTLMNHYWLHACGITEVPFPEVKEGPMPGSTDDLFTRSLWKGYPASCSDGQGMASAVCTSSGSPLQGDGV